MEIRKLQTEDLPTRVKWMNNPVIYSSMHFDLPVTIEKTIQWFNKHQTQNNRFDMVVIDGDEIVAFCGITSIDPIVKKGESYTFVNPELKGRGVGTVARTLLLDYAFESVGLNKVYCFINEDNIPSFKLTEKLGFKLEGRHRKEYLNKDGVFMDRLYYGLLKEEWDAD